MSEELKELLDKKFEEFKQEALKKSVDPQKIEHLEKQLTTLENKYKEENETLKSSLEKVEKKMLQPRESFHGGQEDDLAQYKSSLDTYLRKGMEPEQTLAEKAVDIIYGNKKMREDITVGGNNGYIIDTRKSLEKKTLRVGVDTEGGYFVTPEKRNTPVTRTFETTPMRELAETITIGSDSLELPIDDDQFTSGGWVGEEGTRSVTNNGLIGKLIIPVHEQYAQPRVTQKLLDDASVNIESWIRQKTDDILVRTENTSFVSGSGSKQPMGFLSYSAWTTAGTYERNKLEYVNSGANGTITADGLINTQRALLERYQGRAVWMMNRSAFTEIIKLKDGNGNYLINNEGLREGFSPILLGRPVIFSSDMTTSASFTTGTPAIAYGDFFEGYAIVDRIGIRVLRDPYTAKPYVLFYTTKRVGGGCKNFEAIKINKLSA